MALSAETISEIRKAVSCKAEVTPHNWPEFVWCVSKALGWATMSVLAVIAVVGAVAWQTLPGWVHSTVQVQESLTENLERQTENIVAQTENIEAQTDAIVEVRQAVTAIADSTKLRDDDWKQFTAEVTEVHGMQIETQAKIVEKLDDILKYETNSVSSPQN